LENTTNSFIVTLLIWQNISAHRATIRPIHKPLAETVARFVD